MPAPPPDARSFLCEVASVTPCGDDGVILSLEPEVELPLIRASRFFMLRRDDTLSPAIPRPFSIYRQRGGRLEFLIKVMGRGTQALAGSAPGTRIRAIGPLGNGWPVIDGAGAPWVMLAGGVGSAPFYMAIEQALAGFDGAVAARRDHLFYLFGAAKRGLLYDLEAFEKLGTHVHTATIDGSAGYRGNVLQLLEELQRRFVVPARIRVLACGPERMLEAVSSWCQSREVDGWLSLETLMGCGVGICNGCPIPTRPAGPRGGWPNVKCCVEGPVFRCDEIALDALAH
jgi:dihydroorotate dehydrogenase electron transfer subunit